MTHFFTSHGLPLLFAVVLLESFGIPLPGETALIAFGVLASQGHYSIGWVIVVAAAAGNDEPEREGEREPTRYSRFSSHFLPRCVTKKPIRSASTIPAAA